MKYRDRYRVDSTRLPGWDYAAAGWYFVTICTKEREPFLGEIREGVVHLSPVGENALSQWRRLQSSFPNILTGAFVVMPNHVHGIISIGAGNDSRGDVALLRGAEECLVEAQSAYRHGGLGERRSVSTTKGMTTTTGIDPMSRISPKAGSLSTIVRAYKSAVTRWCANHGHPDFAWQPRFYDHIVRDEQSLSRIEAYIDDNPANWHLDPENTASAATPSSLL